MIDDDLSILVFGLTNVPLYQKTKYSSWISCISKIKNILIDDLKFDKNQIITFSFTPT